MTQTMTSFIKKDQRVKLTLRDSHLLRRGEEKRHHFKLELTLSEGDDTLTGLPEWIQNAYTNLVKSGNLTDLSKFGKLRFENMTLELYSTPRTKQRFFSVINGATLSKFVMTRTGEEDEDAVVALSFSAHFPGRKDVHDWTFDYKNAAFWMAFDDPQGELNLAGKPTVVEDDEDEAEETVSDDEDDDEDEDDDDEDEPQRASPGPEPARTLPLIGRVPRRGIVTQ